MGIQQGAMLGGYLLPKEEFIQALKELFDNEENLDKLKRMIRLVKNNVNKGNIRAAYKNIEDFETKVLNNPATALMVITNLSSEEGEYRWDYVSKERSVINKNGILSASRTFKKSLNSLMNSQLNKHLFDFIKTVENTSLSKSELNNFFNKYNFSGDSKERIGKYASSSGYNLKKIIYGDSPTYRGNIADAFLNHLGNLHKGFLKNGELNINESFNRSVKEEEGENFIQLLIDSTNNTPWWSGGDLIVLDDQGKVLMNIQLKTGLSSGNYNAQISSERLLSQLSKLDEYLKIDTDEWAEYFYKMFETSGVISQVEDKVIDIGNNLIEKNLKIPK